MQPRQSIDRIVLDDGTLPQTDTEAVLEKCYAYYHELGVSDNLRVADKSLRISGIGSVTDYDMPAIRMADFSSDSEAFGLIFVTEDCYQRLLSTLGSSTRKSYVYAYKLAEGTLDADLRRLLVDDLDLLPRLRTFVPAENNNRMGSGKNNNSVYAYAGMIVGIGLMILISVVFFIRVQFSLDKQSPSIGALLAMGVKMRDIYPMLLLPFAMVAFVGGLAGFILSCVFPLAELVEGEGFYSVPQIPMVTHPLIFAYSALVPPIMCTLINLILMRKRMAQSAGSLLVSSHQSADGLGGIALSMVIGTLLAVSVFMMGRGVGSYSTTVAERIPIETKYEYAYELAEEQTEVPAGAQGAFTYRFAAVRKRRDIACLSALGYTSGELTWMVTSKLVALACVSAAFSLYVGYRVSLLLMPALIASTPIGLLLDYNLPEFLVHLTGAVAIILLSVLIGPIRIARTDNLYYLRNRE